MRIYEILNYLDENNIGYLFCGAKAQLIHTYSPLKDLKPMSISWARSLDEELIGKINRYRDVLIICPVCEYANMLICNYIATENPHRTFFKVIEKFFYSKPDVRKPVMSVVETDDIGQGTSIGELCYIGPEVKIGKNCIIRNNVTIENCVSIGDNVIIDSGVRIGTWGFGHYLNDDGTNAIIPHIGGVRIGNNVFIGANTIVARGTLSDTIIKDNALIDALCGICHNSEIQERVIIAGGAGVAGSAVVRNDSWLAPGCIINSGVNVGEHCLIGINSVVSHDVPAGKYAFGIPAKVISDNNDKKYKI